LSVARFAFSQTEQEAKVNIVTSLIELWQFIDLALKKKAQISTVEDEKMY